LLSSTVDGVRARLIDAYMELIGVEELALLLSRERVISSNEDGNRSGSRISSSDVVVNA